MRRRRPILTVGHRGGVVVKRAALLALAYIAMLAAMLAALAIHYDVTLKLVAVVMTCAGIVGFVIFVDETRQQRRKRRHPIIKDWKE